MTRAEHTPGPWRVSDAKSEDGEVMLMSEDNSFGRVLAFFQHVDTGRREMQANAELCASAPAMLELIERIDQTLRVSAAEYVPAIGDVFKLIDEFRQQAVAV